MEQKRKCSKPGCREVAVATLTYVYADSTVVLGQLSTYAEPHTYDFCKKHTQRLNVPQGWEVIHLDNPELEKTEESDFFAIADAVKEKRYTSQPTPSVRAQKKPLQVPHKNEETQTVTPQRGSHLRIVSNREE